jgi:outer membrane receptor for ferrienterochelin and colicin
MSIGIHRFGRVAAVLVALVALAAPVAAQVTTGGLSGQVVAQSDRSALPGVAIEAIHVPTGTRYAAVTNESGRFTIVNARVGGPYSVKAALSGFRELEAANVYVSLGDVTNLAFEMTLDTVEEIIEVVGSSDDLISADRTGSSSSVSLDVIESLPTVRRQLQDYARLNPYFTIDPSDQSGTRLSVAGKNNRYNTIQIDGAVNNDLFGLADTGTPGGQADTQPINLDSIQELQLVVSPYDVRQGGFTGGGINAITRSGANQFSGSIYGSMRDEDYVGDGPLDRPISEFSEDQYGARLGGPILRDKLFFFASGEMNRREAPTGVAADGSAGTQFNQPVQAAAFRQLLINRYGYDPGPLSDFPATQDSDLAFLRFDWNAAPNHSLTLRHNYVDGFRDVVGDRSSTRYRFETAIYAFDSETNSTVAQLNSIFGANMFNEARVSFQTIRDARATPVIFPTIEIGTTSQQPTLAAGTERFSGANSLDQDILAITDDFTLIKGNHTLTIGTHNEIFEFKNLFLSEFYGMYRFTSVANFEADNAAEYRISFANGSDPRRPAQFEVGQYGLYVGDQWRVNDRFSLVFGLRADMLDMVDTPSYNPAVFATYGYSTSGVPDNDVTLSPRLGFNYAISPKQQFRGGVGIFAGRTPYVWVSNAFGNTGIESTALSCIAPACTPPPFNPDPNNQPRNLGAAGTVSVDLVDPDFELPRVMRATLGYDHELPWGVRATFEGVYTETQKDVYYQNLNRVPTGGTSFDGRPLYTRKSTAFLDTVILRNTSEGEQLNASMRLTKRFDMGLYVDASYAWMDAESAFDSTSSRAISSWRFMPVRGDIYNPEMSTTNWEVEHNFNIALSYAFRIGSLGNTVALFYNAQSGRPYSVLQGGTDINGDGYNSNDLLWVAANPNDIVLRNTTWEEYDAWAKSLGLKRGQIQERNSLQARWARSLDFHYDIEIPIKVVRTQLAFDIMNLVNLIDSDKGLMEFVPNQSFTPLAYRGIDAATGKPIYEPNFSGALSGDRQYSANDLRSRWQMKLGLRFSF